MRFGSKPLISLVAILLLSGVITIIWYQMTSQNGREPTLPQLNRPSSDQPKSQVISSGNIDELQQQVESYFNSWETLNYRTVLSFYLNSSDTIVEWSGKAGTYAGSHKIFLDKPQIRAREFVKFTDTKLMPPASPIASLTDIKFTLSKLQIKTDADKAVVSLKVNATGHGKWVGSFVTNVNSTMTWKYIDHRWLIVNDKWYFVETSHEYEKEIFGPDYPYESRYLPYWP